MQGPKEGRLVITASRSETVDNTIPFGFEEFREAFRCQSLNRKYRISNFNRFSRERGLNGVSLRIGLDGAGGWEESNRAGQDEEKVAEPVEPGDQATRNLGVGPNQRNHLPLNAPADRPRDV